MAPLPIKTALAASTQEKSLITFEVNDGIMGGEARERKKAFFPTIKHKFLFALIATKATSVLVARASRIGELMIIKFRRKNKTAVLFYQSRLFLLFWYHRKQVFGCVA